MRRNEAAPGFPLLPRRRHGVGTSERQLGLLWGLVAVLILTLSPWAGQVVTRLPACPFKMETGLPCLGCGTTRSALALARLDLLASLEINPLATLAWVGLLGGGIVAGTLSLAGVPVHEPDWRVSRSVRWLLVITLSANWVYLIAAGV